MCRVIVVLACIQRMRVHIARMCDAFTSLGHEVTLVAAHSSEPTTVREFYGLDGDFDTVSLDPWDGVRGWSHVAAAKTALIARRRKADFVYGRFAWGCALSGMAAVPFAVEFHTPPQPAHSVGEFAGRAFDDTHSSGPWWQSPSR